MFHKIFTMHYMKLVTTSFNTAIILTTNIFNILSFWSILCLVIFHDRCREKRGRSVFYFGLGIILTWYIYWNWFIIRTAYRFFVREQLGWGILALFHPEMSAIFACFLFTSIIPYSFYWLLTRPLIKLYN